MSKLRIGLFGGTFDPIHKGHLKAASIVQKKFLLDKVLFIPSHIPPHKERKGMASPFHRMQMVDIALNRHARFVSSSLEVEAKGTSYSIVTLKKVRKMFPDAWLFFILGVDAFLEIDTWKDYERVLEQCLFIVIERPGYALKNAKDVLGGRCKEKMMEVPHSRNVDEKLFSSHRIFLFPIKALPVSSTEIRNRIKQGKSVTGMVSGDVLAYIKKHRLYG